MREEIEQLIDRLASKELTFGRDLEDKYDLSRWIYLGSSKTAINGVLVGGHVFLCSAESPRVTKELQPSDLEAFVILGHEIHLHDVLGKIDQEKVYRFEKDLFDGSHAQYKIVWLWSKCGFAKSLNQILSDAEWEEERACGHFPCQSKVCGAKECRSQVTGGEVLCSGNKTVFLVPKQPHIRELFNFLLQLDL